MVSAKPYVGVTQDLRRNAPREDSGAGRQPAHGYLALPADLVEPHQASQNALTAARTTVEDHGNIVLQTTTHEDR